MAMFQAFGCTLCKHKCKQWISSTQPFDFNKCEWAIKEKEKAEAALKKGSGVE